MKPLAALAALTVALATTVAPAFARTSYVVDDAHLLSQNAITQIDQQVSDFHAQTGKEVVVVTTPSLNGETPQAALERSFAQQQVNGVEIFIAKQPKTIEIVGDRASQRFFPPGSFRTIYQSMRASFNAGNYDEGVVNAVGLVINMYRSHLNSAPGARHNAPVVVHHGSTGGSGVSWFWWIVILAVGFFIIRGIFRAMSGPRMMGGPGYGPGGPGYGAGPGYGGPGYGGGYGPGGGFGGGGGFWSGLLGGLGGAWLGNELFGGRREEIVQDPNTYAGTYDPGQAGDASGWQSDPGQIDTSNIGGGSWGDSGGGGDWGGGGGDFGGGGGDNSGGGW